MYEPIILRTYNTRKRIDSIELLFIFFQEILENI